MSDRVPEGSPVLLIVVAGERVRHYYVWARRGKLYSTIAGVVRGDEIVGAEWGSSIELAGGARAYILKPTLSQLMEEFYERVTQVIYPKDLGYIVLRAGIARGSRVLEGGTGSGFLTTVLALTVCPEGKVYTYDVKEDNLRVAARNLRLAGLLSDCVEFRLGDVRRGVELTGLDAVFLDIPDPWEALGALRDSVKLGSPAVVFLPTMTQLDKLLSLKPGGWIVESAHEIMLRDIEMVAGAVRPSPRMIGHTGYIIVLRRVTGD